MQKIKLNIGNRIYPLSVDEKQEEILRKASKKINEMINDYESKYAVKDKQDSLAMCALQILSQSKIFINSDDKENRALVSSEFKLDTSEIAEFTFMMALISSSVSNSIFDKSLETF